MTSRLSSFLLITLFFSVTMALPAQASERWVRKQKEAFKDLDVNGDKKWTLKEYTEQLDLALGAQKGREADKKKAKEEAIKMYKIIDKNADESVTVEEFADPALMNKLPK